MFSLTRRIAIAVAFLVEIVPAFAQVPAPVPALPDSERRTSYSITASQCSCAANFAIFGDAGDFQNWVEVYLNGTLVNFNDPVFGWTITSPSGPLANLARPITNAVLTFTNAQTGTVQIVGARRPRRVSQFSENAGVSARNLNQVLTDIIAQNREIWDKTNDFTGRAIVGVPGETFGPLPPAASRANGVLCFNASGLPTICGGTLPGVTVSPALIPFVQAASIAAAWGVLGTIPCAQTEALTGDVTKSAGTCATAINYTIGATGGVSRSLASKLGDFISVADFGAADDGSTDNTPKIQAAINAATAKGRTLYFPLNNTGVYLLNSAFNSGAVLSISAPLKLVCEPGVWLKPSSAITNTQSILFFEGTSTLELLQSKTIVDGCNIGDPAATTRFENHGIVFDTTLSNTNLFVQPVVQNLKITYANINSHSCFLSLSGCAILVNNIASNTTGGTVGALFQNSMLAGGVNFRNAGDSNAVRNVYFPPDLTDANVSNEGVYANLIPGAGGLLLDNINCVVLNGCIVIDNATSALVQNPNFEQISTNSESNASMIDLGSSVAATTVGLGPVVITGGQIISDDCTNNPFLITYNKVVGGYFDGIRLSHNCASYPHALLFMAPNSSFVGIGAGNLWLAQSTVITSAASQYLNSGTSNYKVTTGAP